MKVLEISSHSVISLKNILLATDFSEVSEAALPYAAAISRRYGSQLHLAHIISPASFIVGSEPMGPITIDSLREAVCADARRQMESLTSQLKTVAHHTYIREGGVWEALSEIVRTHEIDLLVVGTHGRTGVGKLVLGSKAEKVLRQAPCPVLTIGPKIAHRSKLPAIEGDGKELTPVEISVRQIVYASDFSRESLTAAPFATSLAQEFQARLTLLHVIQEFDDIGRRSRLIDVAMQRLEDLVPEKADLWYSPRPVVQFGSPADCILQEAVDLKADLIVLGVRSAAGHLGAATHLPWTTAHKVIVHAPCPVLTVPFTAAAENK